MDEEKRKSGDTTIKIRRATKDKFDDLYGESGFANTSMFVDELLEHWEYPIKKNKELEEKVKQLKELESKLDSKGKEIEDLKKELSLHESMIEDKNNLIASLNKKLEDQDNNHKAAIDELNAGYTSKREKTLKDHILVPVTPLDRMCLEWMTERERKERKRNDISIEHFFMYVVREMLIEGNKWSFPCVPDSKIREFEKIIKEKENGNE